MASQHYSRAPIVEAIIDMRFEGRLSLRDMERLRDHFRSDYPTVEDRQQVTVEFRDGKITAIGAPSGFKMTAKNAADLVLITEESFATVRLAPYDEWGAFKPLAQANFDGFTKIIGRRKILRIGVRFVNRIDIPDAQIVGREMTEFLAAGISVPENVSKEMNEFAFTYAGVSTRTGAKIVIRSAIQPPALIDHTSVSLDIDAAWDANIPGRIDEIWEKTDILRDTKNDVFENCITDRTRDLIR
jgi:uncharacterized protein (TIGR04255 family)